MSTGSPALLASISLLKLSACLRYSLAVSVCPCCLAARAASLKSAWRLVRPASCLSWTDITLLCLAGAALAGAGAEPALLAGLG